MLNPNLKMITAYKNSQPALPRDADLDKSRSESPITLVKRPERRTMTAPEKMPEGPPDRARKFV